MSTQPFSLPGSPSTAPGSTVLQRAYPQLTGTSIQDLQPILNKMCDWIFQLATQIGSPITTTGSTATTTGLHNDRINRFPATNLNVGDRFIETDRGEVEYAVGLVGAVKTWVFLGGTYANTLANRPTDLGTNDSGFVFFATDTTDLYRWSGSAWIYFGGALAAQDFNPVADGGASLGTTALRFLNAFIKSGLNIGGASTINYPVEILNFINAQLHLSDQDADTGMWVWGSTAQGGIFISYGAFKNGANWIAKATSSAIMVVAPSGLAFYVNTGLTINVSFAPTLVFQFDAGGNVVKCGTLAATTINATVGFQANGTAGITGTMNIPAATSAGSIVIKEGIITAFTNPVGN